MNYLITIVGPTGIGKTKLSIQLAQHFGCEILSCDSRQFYKEMRIGTAVPSTEELQTVKHHFIQNRSIFEGYSVGQFEKDALKKLDELFVQKNTVVMVGGSGLYVDAVLNGLDTFPDVSKKTRDNLIEKLNQEGIESLQQLLSKLDAETYQKIDIQNPHRVIRALEICLETGEKYSSFKNKDKPNRNFTAIIIGIDADRKLIYKRIEDRVDLMMQDGLLNEVKTLYSYKELNALQTVGYRELFDYLDGKFSLDFAVSEIKKNSRRYAKRQNTWFKRKRDIQWFDYQTDMKSIIEYLKSKM